MVWGWVECGFVGVIDSGLVGLVRVFCDLVVFWVWVMVGLLGSVIYLCCVLALEL